MSNTHKTSEREARRAPFIPDHGHVVPDDGYSRGAPIPMPAETVDLTWQRAAEASARYLHHGEYVAAVDSDHTDILSGDIVRTAFTGRPTGWSEALPDPDALPVTDSRITRSRKGRSSYRTVGRYAWHRNTVGHDWYVDPVLDTIVRINGRDERSLIAAAEAFYSVMTRGERLPKLIGATTTRPETIPGDRGTLDATSVDDDDYVPSTFPVYRRRFVEVCRTVTVRRGNKRLRRTELTVRDMAPDEPSPRPASLCAVRHDELATFYGLPSGTYLDRNVLAHRANDTDIADRHPRRTLIARGNRLPKCLHRHVAGCTRETRAVEPCDCRPVDCQCGLQEHGLAVVGTWTDDKGRERETIGRRVARSTVVTVGTDRRAALPVGWHDIPQTRTGESWTADTTTELVTFADRGWFVGHRFVAPAATTNDREATSAREATLRDALSTVRNMTVGTPERPTAGSWVIAGATYTTPATAALALQRTH